MATPTTKDIKWMQMCEVGAEIFSTCSKNKYFAIVLDQYDHQIASGWNGGPKGMQHCTEGGCRRLYEQSSSGSDYSNCIAIHAEQNALLHSDYTARRNGAKIYVNGPPCFSCAKLITNSGIKKVVCKTNPDYADWPNIHVFLIEAGVEVVEV